MKFSSVAKFGRFENRLTEGSADRLAMYRDPQFADEIGEHVDQLVAHRQILSLDVFDTLLLRDNSSELSRFIEIGRRIAKHTATVTGREVNDIDGFVARELGTKATYRASRLVNGCREGSLTEIHQTASGVLSGSHAYADAFVEIELTYESETVTLNPFWIDVIERHRENGGRVLLLTDMYMHASQVAQLLERAGLERQGYDFLISSADEKLSKASGQIFSFAEDSLSLMSDDFVHFGDSLRGDFVQPRRSGWTAMHLPVSHAAIAARKDDHMKSLSRVVSEFGFTPSVACPQ